MSRGPNPFTSIPGSDPPLLTGRSQHLAVIDENFRRLGLAKPAEALAISGPAGIGVTALLRAAAEHALNYKWAASVIGVAGHGPHAGRAAALPFDQVIGLGLRGAVDAFEERMPGSSRLPRLHGAVDDFVRSSTSLTTRLTDCLERLGSTMLEIDRGLVVFIDDAQLLDTELDAVSGVATESADRGIPATVVFGGLPAPPATARSTVISLGPLSFEQIEEAVVGVTDRSAVEVEPAAIDRLATLSRGVPFLVQSFAEQAWESGSSSTITLADVDGGRGQAQAAIRDRWYLPRTTGVSGTERRYLAAMAEAGGTDVDPEFIARRLGDTTRFNSESSQMGQARRGLMQRRLIYSRDGEAVSFSLPSFASFLATS